MNGWLLAAIILAVAIVVIIKRLRGEPVNARDLFVPPVVLIAIGVTSLAKADGLTGTDYAWAAAGAVLGCALGALRGATVRLFDRDGVLWQRYTGRTFLVTVLSLLAMAGYGLLATKLGMHEKARPTQLGIGISFLGEALAVAYRGLATGTPFAAERGRERV
ncbi:DUF1453 family protein [Streptomyces piniterrae]|uniref:DUF1453 family protein n=1 Tax=Streptomyces piniterrae TaxID=2571125 RepID=A0A4U0MPK8_9ACTN|nr:DUF1453 family protein [Streptomyces piniterrae]TJZ42761.1 DUF1453 family protein [Streptomyces piniterrae]